MTALDTNVLVRFLTQDDEPQFLKVLEMLDRKDQVFFLCDLVLVETDWVLRSLYRWTAMDVADAFARLLTIHNLVFEHEARLRASIKGLRHGADLADEMIVRTCMGHVSGGFATFDKGILHRHKPFAAKPGDA